MTLKKTRLWVLLAACVAAPVFAQNVAVVNGTPIPKAQANALFKQVVSQGMAADPAQLRHEIRENLVNSETLTQEAIRRGLLSNPDVKAQIALAQKDVLIQALSEDFVKHNQPTDAEIRMRYNQLAGKIGHANEYHLHHILVDNEQEAVALIAKLKAGANFETLAKQYSKDPGSVQTGGDLGWANPNGYPPAFAQAASHLQKGQITDVPVHTQYGWHIIRADDLRPLAPPPLDAQVRAQITQQLLQEKWQAFIVNLRKRAKVQ